MFQTLIVVGVGGSPVSWQPLTWAEAEASATGGRLLICHAVGPTSPLVARPGSVRLSTIEIVEPALARAIAAVQGRLGGDRVSVLVRPGTAGELLVEAGASADMVIVGEPNGPWSHDHGSTTHYVVERSASPVVVVRVSGGSASTGPRGSHRPFAGHVVVGVDGSAPARAALEFAFRHAAAHRRPLAVVAVTRHGADDDLWFDDTYGETHLTEEPAEAALLEGETRPWRLAFPHVAVKRAIFAGHPIDGLVRASAGAHLLVVGSRGLGRVRRAILGSVSHGAVDQARCPVAVVHGDETRSFFSRGDALRGTPVSNELTVVRA